ncbi:DUF4861 family protein [Sphingomonas sp.]|uniref:DUF4861 family protein n=1 Tax=Sphingomonas sp. TaxID=28214 RepID=UPI002DD6A721|nr:DUF4861 family protein [Sphingomonas sp.]
MELVKPVLGLAALALGVAAPAQQRAPMRAATPAERTARAAVVIAGYRHDDLLWENDLTAHRIYGRALEAIEPPSSSGIDAWGRRVPWPYMDRQLRTGDQHADHGEGLDFYNVGTGRGTGGLGIWQDNKLWTSRNYVRARILSAGPQVADFTVDYPSWPVDVGRWVRETRRFTLPAGTHFTQMVSTLTSNRAGPLIVGIGISKRPIGGFQLGQVTKDAPRARLVWWGPTDPARGTMAAAVMVDPGAFAGFAEDADNYLILVRATPGRPLVYYAGAAWDRGSAFATRAAWDAHVAAQSPDFAAPRSRASQ